jgi:hypothetical protein
MYMIVVHGATTIRGSGKKPAAESAIDVVGERPQEEEGEAG